MFEMSPIKSILRQNLLLYEPSRETFHYVPFTVNFFTTKYRLVMR